MAVLCVLNQALVAMPVPPELPYQYDSRVSQPGATLGKLSTGQALLPFISEPSVQEEIKRFTSPAGKTWLNEGLARSRQFRPFILNEIDKRKMPRSLVWLVMIESVFNGNALSRSGAAGLWQFMENSVGNTMVISDLLDERFDFWKSTEAALAKLQYNYEETGDWLLAIAAYNAGLGKIKRLMLLNPGDDFWDLSRKKLFSEETARYVPRFLVVAYFCNTAVSSGLSYDWPSLVAWTRISAPEHISLERLEVLAGIPRGLLGIANAELRRGITPSSTSKYQLKIPQSYLQAVESALADPSTRTDKTVHLIAKGDTIYSIAKFYGASVSSIIDLNPGLKPERLNPGYQVYIPLIEREKRNPE